MDDSKVNPTIWMLEAAVLAANMDLMRVWDELTEQRSETDWSRFLRKRGRTMEKLRLRRFEGAEAWADMVMDTVEARCFIARRRLVLALYGFDDHPGQFHITTKDQPERIGVLAIASFTDHLAAIDPKQRYDAMFTADGGEVFRAFLDPERMVARWLARREAAGTPWKPRSTEEQAVLDAETISKKAEYKRLRSLMYSTGMAVSGAASQQRAFTPKKAKATLAALLSAGRGGA